MIDTMTIYLLHLARLDALHGSSIQIALTMRTEYSQQSTDQRPGGASLAVQLSRCVAICPVEVTNPSYQAAQLKPRKGDY